jgi:sugar-specific transcriptional regulator TrmB
MLAKLSKQLKNFGLSDNEVAVYTALLTGGSDTASNIAERAKLNRSTTYVQLDSLMAYGLASSFKRGRKHFSHLNLHVM